jgi:hypothetical protein
MPHRRKNNAGLTSWVRQQRVPTRGPRQDGRQEQAGTVQAGAGRETSETAPPNLRGARPSLGVSTDRRKDRPGEEQPARFRREFTRQMKRP